MAQLDIGARASETPTRPRSSSHAMCEIGPMAISFVFFDIGGTLGERDPATGKLHAYPSSLGLLSAIRDGIGMRIGVITTLGPLSNDEGRALLSQAGLASFIDPQGFVSEHDVNGIGKPHRAIYQFAAQRAGVPIENCLYIGENLIEVVGAMASGMQAILKPCPPGRELPI
jgi:FMN phosphatase YigB (HAD superfamily)